MSLAAAGSQANTVDDNLLSREKGWVVPLLTHTAVCAMLLPVGAQSSLAALLGLIFLFRHGFRKLGVAWHTRPLPQLQRAWRRFFQTLALVWLILLVSLVLELGALRFTQPLAQEAVNLHLRNLGKWGVYGCLIVWIFQLRALSRPSGPTIKVHWLLVFTGLYALYMIGQRFYGWDIIHGWDARLGENRFAYGVYRGSGLMGHPLTLAYNAMIFCLLCFGQGLWLWEKERGTARLWFLQSGLLFYIIVLSGSRFPTFVTGVLLGFGFMKISGGKGLGRWALWMGGGLALLGIALVVWLDPNLQGRLQEIVSSDGNWEERFDRLLFWKVHLRMIADHPWFGVGYAAYKEILARYYENLGFGSALRKYNAHNIYLQLAAQAGVLGLVALALFLSAWWKIGRAFLLHWRHCGVLLVAWGTIWGALMQNTLHDSEYLFALWYGLGLVMSWIIDREHESRPPDLREPEGGFSA